MGLLLLIFFEIIAFLICFLGKSRLKEKGNDVCVLVMWAALLALGFEGIYIAFYNQWGPPPGPNLENTDWLSFLAGYLGFAGSLIMAWLVYRQEKKINELLLQEYKVTLKPSVKGIELKKYSDDEMDYYFYKFGGCNDLYIKHDVELLSDYKDVNINNSDLKSVIYFELINMGKLRVDNLCFNSVKIISPETNSIKYEFAFKKDIGGNLLNGSHQILPDNSLCVCLVFLSFPTTLSIHKLQLSFSYFLGTHQEEKDVIFLIHRTSDGQLVFVDGKRVCHT